MNKEPSVWAHKIKSKNIKQFHFEGSWIYYIEIEGIPRPYHIITDLCCGDRYMSLCTGWFSNYDDYRGSTSDNWHGGPQNVSLSDAIEWLAEANHQDKEYTLWFKKA